PSAREPLRERWRLDKSAGYDRTEHDKEPDGRRRLIRRPNTLILPRIPARLPRMTRLNSSYDPRSFETATYDAWEKAGHFKPSGTGEPYTILLPPPNVTGTLHMGHAFQQTLMDALVRYHRMRGYDTLWQVGTDHAGIATEMVVSRN